MGLPLPSTFHGGYLFQSGRIRSKIQKEAQGTKVYGISPARLANIEIAYPGDKHEQQKIADCLSSLDEVIVAQGRKLDALKAQKDGLMQQLFPRVGEILPRFRFPEFRDAPEWEERKAGSLFANRVAKGDPISSLDDNNAVAVAHHLAQLLKDAPDRLRVVVSTHHVLFFNVLCNEMKKPRKYFLTKEPGGRGFTVQETDSTPFLYHLASLQELHVAQESGALYTHHFNMMRRVMEQTACFFGYDTWDKCIKPEGDDPNGTVYKRVIDLMSHGDYSLYEPRTMLPENKEHFRRVFHQFIALHPFSPALFPNETK